MPKKKNINYEEPISERPHRNMVSVYLPNYVTLLSIGFFFFIESKSSI